MSSEIAIEVRDLLVQAGPRALLDLKQWTLQRSRILGLMGPNGAGKTTLLRACLGLVRPTRGSAAVLGEPVHLLHHAALARLRSRIGYVPQLLPSRSEMPLTVREIVAIGRTARAGLWRRLAADDWRVVECWIDRLGLTPLANESFAHISGGEQRKTLIARAMAQEPDLLLLDEPTANLDLGWRERIVETIERLFVATRISILLVCHELEVLPPSCGQVTLLEHGRLTAQGTPQEVYTDAQVQRLYGAGLRTLHQAGRHTVVPATARYD